MLYMWFVVYSMAFAVLNFGEKGSWRWIFFAVAALKWAWLLSYCLLRQPAGLYILFLVHKRKMPLKFGQVWMHLEHLDVFGCVWTHLDRVWTSVNRVWKSLEGVWRSLEKFGGVWPIFELDGGLTDWLTDWNYRNMKWPNQWILAT